MAEENNNLYLSLDEHKVWWLGERFSIFASEKVWTSPSIKELGGLFSSTQLKWDPFWVHLSGFFPRKILNILNPPLISIWIMFLKIKLHYFGLSKYFSTFYLMQKYMQVFPPRGKRRRILTIVLCFPDISIDWSLPAGKPWSEGLPHDWRRHHNRSTEQPRTRLSTASTRKVL